MSRLEAVKALEHGAEVEESNGREQSIVCLADEAVGSEGATPGMKQYGIQSLTLHKDARNDIKVTVDAGWVFDTSKKDFSHLRLWDECEHFALPGQPLPEQITRSPTYTFTAVNDHWTANKADYLQVRPAGNGSEPRDEGTSARGR